MSKSVLCMVYDGYTVGYAGVLPVDEAVKVVANVLSMSADIEPDAHEYEGYKDQAMSVLSNEHSVSGSEDTMWVFHWLVGDTAQAYSIYTNIRSERPDMGEIFPEYDADELVSLSHEVGNFVLSYLSDMFE